MEPDGTPTTDEARKLSVEFHGDQRDIFEALLSRDAQLAEMYVGALRVLDDGANPDGIAQCAHSMRELIEKIPDVVGVRIASLSDLSAEVGRLESAFEAACGSASFCGGKWEGQIDGPLRDLVRVVDHLVAWREKNRKTRREAARETLRELDPSGRGVPGTLGDVNVREWMAARRYFTDLSHHRKSDDTGFRDRITGLERFLAIQLRPRPFADFDEIDRIVAEAESGH
jgi:hypothetical protein